MHTKKLMFVFGTRPEAIKVAPVVLRAAELPDAQVITVSTGQHTDMLDQVLTSFGITVDYDLTVAAPNQGLAELSSKILERVSEILSTEKPDALIVHGDTSTAAMSALAAFYLQIPVIHLEAGLRTGNRFSPFPEEVNRRIITVCADLHLAPTVTSADHLERENVPQDLISITGNTVIDALLRVVNNDPVIFEGDLDPSIFEQDEKIILVTTHRRENLGEGISNIVRAVSQLSTEHLGIRFVLPMHRNPIVREFLTPLSKNHPNVLLCEPQGYSSFSHLMARSLLILTDSGGIQEEAPALNVPVLVMRDTTERPEGIISGAIKLVGTSTQSIVANTNELLTNRTEMEAMRSASNPFGDGQASSRALDAIFSFLAR